MRRLNGAIVVGNVEERVGQLLLDLAFAQVAPRVRHGDPVVAVADDVERLPAQQDPVAVHDRPAELDLAASPAARPHGEQLSVLLFTMISGDRPSPLRSRSR
jgi:hypothetical protein